MLDLIFETNSKHQRVHQTMSFTISPTVEEESTEFRSCEFKHVFIGGLRQTLLHTDFSHSLISVVQMVKSSMCRTTVTEEKCLMRWIIGVMKAMTE